VKIQQEAPTAGIKNSIMQSVREQRDSRKGKSAITNGRDTCHVENSNVREFGGRDSDKTRQEAVERAVDVQRDKYLKAHAAVI